MKTISVFYCLVYATWIEGADIYVKGFEGGEVSFRCSHILAWNKYFCKDPCKDTDDILATVKSGGRAKSGRITLVDLGNSDVTVTFSHLRLSDSGTYWCAVNRPGFDTFTAVILTVKEDIANDTTTVVPDVSPPWTYQNISDSTQPTSGVDTSRPTNQSTASNWTNGEEQSMSTSTAVVYTSVGGVAVLTIVLAMTLWKRREIPEPQPQVCAKSTDFVSEFAWENSDTGKEERTSRAHHPEQDPPTPASTAAECSTSVHIYENISCFRCTAGSRFSSAQNDHDVTSSIYIKPLP